MGRPTNRQLRHQRLLDLIDAHPLLTDEELASALGVSVSTVRLDRALLGLPELRERTRRMAERATSRLRSLTEEDVVGELLELEPDRWALSVLFAGREMAFRHTRLIWDHVIYTQASTLAIATISANLVVIGSAHLRYKEPAYVGDKLVARAKVGTHKGNKYVLSVRTHVGEREIFVGRFVVAAINIEEN